MRYAFSCFIAVTTLLVAAGAQVSSPAAPDRGPMPPPAVQAQLQSAPAAALNGSLVQLQRAVESTRSDLARLRVEKWKTDSSVKRQTQENIESLQRNMTDALPGMEAQVRANPASLGAAFKLYRNLSALYDVLVSVTESAGAFGPKEEFQALADDTASIDKLRRSLADQVEQMANAKDVQVMNLQAQVAQARQALANVPPKKIVVDENEPAKKPAKKKKPATTTAPTPPPPQ